jgi:hypothetical protein
MPTGGCLKIAYTGAQVSCLLVADSVAKTLTSSIGALGAEAPDASFGTAGVIDLTAVGFKTLEQLKAVIDAYTNYSCSILYGDDIDAQYILSATVQAKGTFGYILFSIVSVLSTYALTTWARVKFFGDYKDSDQTLCEYLLNGATEQAELISGRKLKARTITTGTAPEPDYDGTGRTSMICRHFPINSVTHLYIDSERAFGATTEIVAADFKINGEKGELVLFDDEFTEGVGNVRLEYSIGFTPIPDLLQNAAVEVVAWNLKRFRSSQIGLRGTSAEGINISYELDIPLSAKRVFESYKDHRI